MKLNSSVMKYFRASLKDTWRVQRDIPRLLFPTAVQSPMVPNIAWLSIIYEGLGFMSPTKTMEYLYPYFRFKFFSSAKFNQKIRLR
jgi:outer membrane protein insertion porin family